jgi:hypothetical protein
MNRTRSKLPTKRKTQRQKAAITDVSPPTVVEYEVVVSMPRNRHRSDPRGSGFRGSGRGGRGGVSHGHRTKGIFCLRSLLT